MARPDFEPRPVTTLKEATAIVKDGIVLLDRIVFAEVSETGKAVSFTTDTGDRFVAHITREN